MFESQMKTVTLFRHAKSDWKDSPSIDDFDRPLADRGLKAAPKMGRAMRENGITPDLILCSSSVRTRQTLALAEPEAWDILPDIRFEDALYHAKSSAMTSMLQELPETVAHVMIVGHNPGLQKLAMQLTKAGDDAETRLADGFPTAAVATLSFDIEAWGELSGKSGSVELFLTPKSLKSA